MGLEPEPSWVKRHGTFVTIVAILLIAAAGTGLKFAQQIYFPMGEAEEVKTPVFLNETFEEVDRYFNIDSNMTDDEKAEYFDANYKYNVVKWTCKPLSCQELLGAPTLKLVCKERGFTEDVRIAMKENCTDASQKGETTVIFQLMTKTTGEYYLGRAGRIVEPDT
ncbi:hypothetical protein KY362_05835 [Candidatus Woesearchaeota archaeon]|nr:hypothetical protein [Candidatus Woesearchaeota archaeon]